MPIGAIETSAIGYASLCLAERTGCPILLSLWSYVMVTCLLEIKLCYLALSNISTLNVRDLLGPSLFPNTRVSYTNIGQSKWTQVIVRRRSTVTLLAYQSSFFLIPKGDSSNTFPWSFTSGLRPQQHRDHGCATNALHQGRHRRVQGHRRVSLQHRPSARPKFRY